MQEAGGPGVQEREEYSSKLQANPCTLTTQTLLDLHQAKKKVCLQLWIEFESRKKIILR